MFILRRSFFLFLLTLTLSTMLLPLACRAGELQPMENKVVLILVHRVSLEDLVDPKLSSIQKMMTMGGTGVMTLNTAGGLNDAAACLSIGAGRAARSSTSGASAFNVDESTLSGLTAADIYRGNTGLYPGKSRVLALSLPRLQRANTGDVGILGEALQRAGFKAAVLGNGDGPADHPNRPAPLITMDAKGQVWQGDVGTGLLRSNPEAPYGISTDYHLLREKIEKLLPRVQLLVVDTGDTLRLDNLSGEMTEEAVTLQKERALTAADKLIGQLLPMINNRTMLMVVAPLPPGKDLQEGKRMAPVLIAGGNIPSGSLLTSPTTRHPGLVVNYDLAPTILAHLGIAKPGQMIGMPVTGTVALQAPVAAIEEFQRLANAHRIKPVVLSTFLGYTATLLTAFLAALYLQSRWLFRQLKRWLFSLLVAPAAMLLISLTGVQTLKAHILLLILFTAGATFLLELVKDTLSRLFVLAGITYFVLVLSIFGQSGILERSALGYDPVLGGRFYGIGNEYMAVLVACTIWLLAGMARFLPFGRGARATAVTLFSLFTIYLLAAPGLGTNAGGTLAAATGFFFLAYELFKPRVKIIFVLVTGLVLGLLLLAVVNMTVDPVNQSHIGRALAAMGRGDYLSIINSAGHKLAANWYLIRFSGWTRIVTLMLVCLGILYWRHKRDLQRMVDKQLPAQYALKGITVSAMTALAFNDSGLIAAAILVLFLAVPLSVLFIDWHNDLQEVS